MRKISISGARKPKTGRRAGAGGRMCFGPNCGSARKAGGKKKGR